MSSENHFSCTCTSVAYVMQSTFGAFLCVCVCVCFGQGHIQPRIQETHPSFSSFSPRWARGQDTELPNSCRAESLLDSGQGEPSLRLTSSVSDEEATSNALTILSKQLHHDLESWTEYRLRGLSFDMWYDDWKENSLDLYSSLFMNEIMYDSRTSLVTLCQSCCCCCF